MILAECRSFAEDRDYDLSTKNLKNLELVLRSSAELVSQALSEVMSERAHNRWKKGVQETTIDWSEPLE